MVVAETPRPPRDGAERVVVDWEPLPAVTATLAAAGRGAPLALGRRRVERVRRLGRRRRTRPPTPPSRAPPTSCASTRGCRASPACRWSRARPSASGTRRRGRYTLYAARAASGRPQTDLAGVLGVPESAVRVMARDVGGNFGTRNSCYPEFALVAWAARRLGRPVKWTGDRREAFLTDYQAPRSRLDAELALDAEGTLPRAARRQHQQRRRPRRLLLPAQQGHGESRPRVYHVPAASMRGRAVLTNTSPTTPYRSAGRPEVMFVMERLIDLAARRHGFDRVELRRRNLVPPERDAVPQSRSASSTTAATTRPRRTARVALADWAGIRGAPRGGAPARALPRHRRRQLHRAQHRRPARARADHRAPGGPRSTWCSARCRPARATRRASPSSSSSGSAWSSPRCA